MEEKWYNIFVKDEFDGLVPLLNLFKTEDEFFHHYIENIYFFRIEDVISQIENIEKVKLGDKYKHPVRYSEKSFEHFRYKNDSNVRGFSKKKFKNKKDAILFSDKNSLFYNFKTDNPDLVVKVIIDKDGNYEVRKAIRKATGYRISEGALVSDFKNFMICHVWGKTHHPFFFSSLWNVTIIPNYLSFLTDKTDVNNKVSNHIKKCIKAICYQLYKPVHLTDIEIEEFQSEISNAKKMINEGKIKFLNKKEI